MASKNEYDYIIVGSGFGGSVSAYRLSEKGYKVLVVEQGRRWTPENLPRTNWRIWNYLWMPLLALKGFLRLRLFKHVMILHGNAVGGGSITYAQTLLVPPDSVWDEGNWAGLDQWQRTMPAHYATAKRMLGVTENKRPGPADARLKDMAQAAGVEDSFYYTQVGVFFGNEGDEPGQTVPDPYFGGDGPERTSCLGCGACMVGCRHGAKNTLDKNYLYLAEKRGVTVLPDTEVTSLEPVDGGYVVRTKASRWFGARDEHTADRVVLAGGVLGTTPLLMKMKKLC